MAILLALGRGPQALAVCDRVIALNPGDLDALFNRAILLSRLGRLEDALAAFDQVLARSKDFNDALFERGNVLAALSRYGAAAESYASVLSIAPSHLGALTNRGNALMELKRHAEALECYDKMLAISREDKNALSNRAIALKELGRYEEALAGCERVLAKDPAFIAALLTRGNTLVKLGRHEEALASFERALVVKPDDVEALNNRGFVLTLLQRIDEALADFDRALAIQPAHVGVLDNKGVALFAASRFAAALATFDRALAINADRPETLYNRGQALANLAKFEEATRAWEQTLAIDPAHSRALSALAFYQLMLCNWRERERLGTKLKQALATSDAIIEPFTLLAYAIPPADHLRHVRQYARHRIPAVAPFAPVPRQRSRGKVKVAYLSSAFQRHPTGWQIAELIELHDRSRFEVLGISYGPDDGSEIRARLAKAFDRFCDVAARSDREVAQLIREADVDIAIDLKGFTEQSRPAILAYRPAPVEASYFGYVGTMGVDFIDYIIADRIVLPPEQQEHYSEKIVYLPDSYWVNDSKRIVADATPSRSSLGLPEDGFVFCSFNNSYKITPEVFDIWMRLLRQIEGSVLWLLQTSDAATRNLRNEARARDVDPERLVFAPKTEIAHHLARHRAADLFLDNLPVNAHTAASDALWVGLPVVTCAGDAFIGRVAASLVTAAGLPELVTYNLDDYHALALKLATDRQALRELRERLIRSRPTSRLFDTNRLCRHIEQAYEIMLDIFQRGEPARGFAVEPLQDR